MNIKLPTVAVVVIIFIFLSIAYLAFFQKKAVAPIGTNLPPQSPEVSTSPAAQAEDEILKNALNLYIAKKQAGTDFASGPCLGKVASDWVVDIAHNPRQAIDNKKENQCEDFINGSAHHFIELDPDGKLIRSY